MTDDEEEEESEEENETEDEESVERSFDPFPHQPTAQEILIGDRYTDSILGVVEICRNAFEGCDCNFHQLRSIVESADISTWYISHYIGGPLHCIYHRRTEFNLDNFCSSCHGIQQEIHHYLEPNCDCVDCSNMTENLTDTLSGAETSFDEYVPDEDIHFPM